MHIGDFYAAAARCAKEIDAFAQLHGLMGKVQGDHLCYKCDSKLSFEARREALEPETEYLHQTYISGRRIAYLKLKRPVETAIGPIRFLELSDQKPDGSQKDEFDHVELYPLVGTYDELVRTLERGGEKVIKVERPHHTTHDIELGSGFLIRLCAEPLVQKIKREEMK